MTTVLDALAGRLRAGLPAALATIVGFGEDGHALQERDEPLRLGARILVMPARGSTGTLETVGSLGDPGLDEAAARDALGAIDTGHSSIRHYGRGGEARMDDVALFIHTFTAPPHMIIFGAVDFSASLAQVAKVIGYRVTVCDARATFATVARFPMADEVVVQWPNRFLEALDYDLGPRDAVCVLTHDHKFDVPAIAAALRTRVGYIGAMGSRRTTAERSEMLREIGVDEGDLSRVMAPIGLDIGARTPEETAIAICAEIISRRAGGSATSLSETAGPIHRTEIFPQPAQ